MVPHTTTGEWQSFEVRMRRRRAERLALRAEVAAEAGYLDDARAALDEARELLPTLPQLDAIEALLSRPPRRVSTVARRRLTACVSVAATAAVVAVGISAMPDRAATMRSRPIAEFSPTLLPATPVSVKLPASQPVVREEPTPLAEAPAAPLPLPAVVARSGEIQPDALPAIALAAPAAPPLVAVDPAPVPAIPPSSELPLSELPSPEPPQEPLVRGVLNRYASAFNALDAAAAQRVWPRVNRAALSRAFEGLASQQIALADCRIDVAATIATARCGGTATWAPKVGGGTRTESRDWHFELTRGQTGWQIVSATVQNR